MYYCLNKDFELCSYLYLPCGLRNRKTNKTQFCGDRENYMLLYKCSGKVDFDTLSLTEEQKKFLDLLTKQGVLDAYTEPHPLAGPIPSRIYECCYMRSVQWSVTGKCNYKCRHCFQSAPLGKLGQPSLEQLLDIIRQFDECGIREVDITGGEPLIRSDLFEIIDALIAHGIHLNVLYSNGALVNEALLKGFEDRGIRPSFQISFDGVGWHDWIRGIPGAEKMALDAIRLLKSRGFSVSCAFSLCRENRPSLLESIRLLESLGVSGFKVQRCMPQGQWLKQKEHYLEDDELLDFYMELAEEVVRAGVKMPVQMEGVLTVNPDKKGSGYRVSTGYDKEITEEQFLRAPSCGILRHAFFVGPNGAVVPCMSMCGAAAEELFPNLFETPLKEILTDSDYLQYSRASMKEIVEHNEKCRGCEHAVRCGGGKCRAAAVGDTGTDYYCIDDFVCYLFESGRDAKLKALADRLTKESAPAEEPEA